MNNFYKKLQKSYVRSGCRSLQIICKVSALYRQGMPDFVDNFSPQIIFRIPSGKGQKKFIEIHYEQAFRSKTGG
jgi:hypothetical protein